ncbi:hypothetical protein C8D88_1011820 [Lentzea atacamensis]|uniref:Uncharacterized protein n=1 Tax=Lentzea atacamensis TaxID=531938 RepID=A0A316IEW1_9PSEU|nr:hypothetical protein [Lentzea atacamensis]PWK91781.1 hypothetical protein C8D88_1011820 [Lentzea atacamensis]
MTQGVNLFGAIRPTSSADSTSGWRVSSRRPRATKYGDVVVVVRDSNGWEIGRYNLGQRFPPR